MVRTVLFWAFVLLLGAVMAWPASAKILEGVWTATRSEGHHISLQLRHDGGGWSSYGLTLSPEDLVGWSPDVEGRSEFRLVREAGEIVFVGEFRRGEGAGHYRFTPDEGFREAMRTLGISRIDDAKQMQLAFHDVTTQLVRELKELGYEQLSVEDLIRIGIFRVTPEFIRELRELGYGALGIDTLVDFRSRGVTAEFIRGLESIGCDELSV